MAIQLQQLPIEAYDTIAVVERYHKLLRRAYFIIKEELKTIKNTSLKIFVKIINNIDGLNGTIPNILIFGVYSRMLVADPPHQP